MVRHGLATHLRPACAGGRDVRTRPRDVIVVGQLENGEVSQEASRRSLSSQKCSDERIETRVFSRMPQRSAHIALYRYFNSQRQRAAMFLKLDADMVLTHNGLLSVSRRVFGEFPEILRLTYPLYDPLLGQNLYGLHVWSHNVRWFPSLTPKLTTDQPPDTVGQYVVIPKSWKAIGIHAPKRNSLQVATFVGRRVLKMASVLRASAQKDTLDRVLQQVATSDEARIYRCEAVGAMLMAAISPAESYRAIYEGAGVEIWLRNVLELGSRATVAEAREALSALSSRVDVVAQLTKSAKVGTRGLVRRLHRYRDVSQTMLGGKVLHFIGEELKVVA